MSFQDLAALYIVLSPGIAAAIAGLGQRFLGNKGAMAITTAPLVVAAGLAAYLFTRDLGRAYRVGESLDFGMVAINDGALGCDFQISEHAYCLVTSVQ